MLHSPVGGPLEAGQVVHQQCGHGQGPHLEVLDVHLLQMKHLVNLKTDNE